MKIEGAWGDPIRTIEDWRRFGPPAQDKHWKDDRSAAELARFWVGEPSQSPSDAEQVIKDLLVDRFDELELVSAVPESKSRFDRYRGNVRNHDLLIKARCRDEDLVIAVEGKADESFGEPLAKQFAAAKRAHDKASTEGRQSNSLNRLDYLTRLFLDMSAESAAQDRDCSGFGYQLLTALAGTLAEAKDDSAAVFLVHEFNTCLTEPAKRKENDRVYRTFVGRMGGKPTDVAELGWVTNRVPFISEIETNSEFRPATVELVFAKLSTRVEASRPSRSG